MTPDTNRLSLVETTAPESRGLEEERIPRWQPQGFCKENSGVSGTPGTGEGGRGAERGPHRLRVQAPGACFSPWHPEAPPPGASGGTDRGRRQWGSRPLLARPRLGAPGRTRGAWGGHVASARGAKYAAPAILCEKPQRRLPARAPPPPPRPPAPRASAASLISVSRRCSLLTRRSGRAPRAFYPLTGLTLVSHVHYPEPPIFR